MTRLTAQQRETIASMLIEHAAHLDRVADNTARHMPALSADRRAAARRAEALAAHIRDEEVDGPVLMTPLDTERIRSLVRRYLPTW